LSARKRLLVGLSICLGAAAVSAPSAPPEAERSNPRQRSSAWRARYGPRAPELAARRLELVREEAQLAAVQGLEWVNLGPTDARFQYNGGVYSQVDSGRITGIAVHPTQPNIVYASTAGGGIWKTFEFSAPHPRWSPIAETLPNLAIGALAMDPRLPDTLYAGLGDAFDVPGGQVVKTTTGGAAWSAPVTLPGASSIRNTLLVLDLVANENLTGYGVGFNLPVDLNRVRLDSLVPGTALPAGSSPIAARAALPLSGPLQGILTAVQSQKASGTGAVASDTAVPAGAVLFTLRLSLASSSPGIIFDGASLGAAFNAAMRDKLGNDVVRRTEFGIGRLEVLSP
jgi:hypothetical protein